jgi:hypothetical protein
MKQRSSHAISHLSNLWHSFNRGLLRSEGNMREAFELKVHLACDEDSGRWYVASSDIPGLRLEDADPLKLVARIQAAAPELIELNQAEILAACKAATNPESQPKCAKPPRPSILPVFDNPLALAHA